jgi:8-oxo-dGTP pyrophosphatase MutT (NUDIX family)
VKNLQRIADSIVKVKNLYKNDWVSLRELSCSAQKIEGYSFIHEDRCDGKIISVLPYRNKNEFLIRKEVTPCWSLSPEFSSITGGNEGNIKETVVLEMKEETGYDVSESELIELGTCYGTKSSDTIYYLFSIDLTGKKQGKATTDGSSLEAMASCQWVNKDFLLTVKDPLVSTIYLRLVNHLK